ncbi:MAG: flagellar motor switch protein FliG [Planctomycetes bacterium]|nr:flagellar motor switch protein FliG [Planctomycetota bacterium]
MAKDKSGGEELGGIRKAAIFFVSLDPDSAAKVMAELDPATIEEVSKEIARLRTVEKDARDDVFKEFYNLHIAQSYINEGGVEYARILLRNSLPPDKADALIHVLDKSIQPDAFTFLRNAKAEAIVSFIKDEHPQTIALIMTHLSHAQAAQLLAKLPQKSQLEVVKRVAGLSQTNPEIIRQVEEALKERIGDALSAPVEEVDGVKSAADILKTVPDRAIERAVLEALEEEDPELADKIRKLMFVFDDILLVNDKGIQNVMKEVDPEELATALKNANDELKDKFFKNMSSRAADILKEDMEFMGPVRAADVESAQAAIIDVVRRLEEQGDLIIEGRNT